ncbi:MAG: hypothetical protein H6Q07_1616 [Acidobacteria bacterium]|nr:hypothetical protein [Acidobacteriota bacterium]
MRFTSRLAFHYSTLVPALLIFLVGASSIHGQTKQLMTWRSNLAAIQTTSAEDLEAQKDAVMQIRTGVEFWLRLHPGTAVQLQSAPPQPWNSEQILQQASALQDAIEAILKEDPNQSFELGVTEISVTAETSPLAPVTDSVDQTEIYNLHATNVTQALQNLPGVSIDHKSSRNQSGVMIRGFDTRQVGIYLDNIPVYVPYDGYADISRFLASDIYTIEVAKGYSSPLLGPGGLGGAINLVTKQPEKKLEGDGSVGRGSGGLLETGFHLGSHWQKFFVRGGMDWLQSDHFPLSGDFERNSLQPTYERVNSDQRDIRYNGRVGYTPNDQDQYVFTYNKQKSDYGAPPYAGNDPQNNKVKYWDWAYWNRDSYYFNSNTHLGESSSLKVRAFWDTYPNRLNMFNDSTFSSQLGQGSSEYDDHSKGLAAEFSLRMFPRHAIGISTSFKDDVHTERSINVDKKGKVTVEPWREDGDEILSFGVQDAITLSSKLYAIVGFSADHMNATNANTIDKNTNTIVPFNCGSTTNPETCELLHAWAYNPLASISYSVAKTGTLFFSFAMKSHFPTLKDRYSYKNGQAVPSPTLQPEHTRNYNLGYSHAFSFNTMIQLELFRSDVYDAIQNATIPAEFPDQCPSLSSTTCRKALNVAKELHQGVEFTIRSTPLRRLSIDANYTYLQRSIDGPPNMLGVYPTGTPKHKTFATAGLQLPCEILLLASVRYESGTVNTNDSGLIVPASKFATADLGGVITIKDAADIQAGVKNLFDRNYNYQEGFPEAGRTWYVKTGFHF